MEADVDAPELNLEPKAEHILTQLLPLPYRVATLLVLGKQASKLPPDKTAC